MIAPRTRNLRFGRLYRVKGRREAVELLDARNNPIGTVADATYGDVAKNTASAVIDIGEDGRSWILPFIQVDQPVSCDLKNWRIEQADGTRWEVMSATLISSGHSWQCICKKMKVN